MKLVVIILFSALTACAVGEKVRFDGYSVQRVTPSNDDQIRLLRTIHRSPLGLSFWTDVGDVGRPVDIMVPPHTSEQFQEIMIKAGIKTEDFILNVQQLIDNEQGPIPRDFGWDNYYDLNAIYDFLDSLVQQYPDTVSSITGGSTYENRSIQGVKVSYKEGNPGVFIEGGIHAREWIGPATVTYILNQLLSSDDPNIRNVAESYDWYIFPSVNPDGYAYTHSTDRLWRGTRSKGVVCDGADPNRNWDFHWLEGGASDNECDEDYAGKAPFSEVETKTLSEYFTQIHDKIKVYLAFHSYSQLLMFSYGYTTAHIPDYDIHNQIGTKAANVLSQRYGTKYTVGNIAETIYVASGVSMDWAKGTYNTTLAYTYELRDTGRYGFVLPADQIVPTVEETLDSVVSILQDAMNVK